MSLFKGRDDVYARRWENREGRSGYTPVCLNEWKSGICRKPAVKCSECQSKSYAALADKNFHFLRVSLIGGMSSLGIKDPAPQSPW